MIITRYFPVEYNSKRNGVPVHTGADSRGSVEGTSIYAGFGGRIPQKTLLDISTIYNKRSSVLTYETGFEFGGEFVSTGVWIQDRHMDNLMDYSNKVFGSGEKLGTLGKIWDKGKIAPHLHVDIITQTSSNDSRWFQNLFNPGSASDITWYGGNNTYNRTYWNARDVWYNYWKEAK